MLYDVFICHASEDKEPFVRPLAEALRARHVEVWYDDFSLKLGDSIRQSIDKGLRQSRFGVVVFSKAFFAKRWPQYELDGLIEREMKGEDRVLLPIWHAIDHDEVMRYVPSLAGRKAARSSAGLEKAVDEILDIVHPQGSPLIHARDTLLKWGVTPPVITDEYWLDVVEASNRLDAGGIAIPEMNVWGRWSFPLPGNGSNAAERGDHLAWTAMQLRWTQDAEERAVTPLTPPDQVLNFIDDNPGLLETCMDYPQYLIEYAPQLAIPGNEGPFKNVLQHAFEQDCAEQGARRKTQPSYGSLLTVDGIGPFCSEEWSIRHPTFGRYSPSTVAGAYFGGGMFGPVVSPHEHAEHVIWLLSSASRWLPDRIHRVLLDGFGSSTWWPWTASRHHDPQDRSGFPAFPRALYDAAEGRKFRWSFDVHEDVRKRIEYARNQLKLTDKVEDLMAAFKAFDFPSRYVAAQRAIRRAQRERATGSGRKRSAAARAKKKTASRRRR